MGPRRLGGQVVSPAVPVCTDTVCHAYAAEMRRAAVQVLIPPGLTPLLGDEPQKCRAFLDAVGLPDEEAALVHLDVGRTFYRQRLEVSDVDEAAAGARTFQKLIYVSSQLFGDVRSGFLTPWVARFGVSPEQVAIAKRESGADAPAAPDTHACGACMWRFSQGAGMPGSSSPGVRDVACM